MKKLMSLASILAVACTMEPVPSNPGADLFGRVFEASLENNVSKTCLDGTKVLWTTADKISIFDRNDGNLEYTFQGKTGDASGKFIQTDGEAGQTALNYIYAVYPYSESFSATEGVIKANWNSHQIYVPSSFGLGENLMVAVSTDNSLMFKNVGSCLKINMKGDGVQVKYVRLYGNSKEKIAGPAEVAASFDEAPVATLLEGAVDTVSLNCTAENVTLSTVDSTTFCFALPPVIFAKGFTIEVIDEAGDVFIQKTDKAVVLNRNTILNMATFEVDLTPSLKRGSGTAEDPYLIGTVKELLALSSLTNDDSSEYLSKCYRMDADIDMTAIDNFTPVAAPSSAAFSGTFDGDNHKITNLTETVTSTAAGLFSHVNDGTIKNVNVASAIISSSQSSVGGIAGRVDGKNSTIQNCVFQGSISGSNYRVGGIVGVMTAGKVKGCVLGSKGSVMSSNYGVGGIVGEAICNKFTDTNSLEISNSACYGSVNGKYSVGGIVGTFTVKSGYSGRIINCASISSTVIATGYDGSKRALVGGIVGMVNQDGILNVVDCYSRPFMLKDTDTSTSVGCVGGIAGGNYCTGTANYIRCYSNVVASAIYKGTKSVSGVYTGTCYYAAILGRTYKTGTCTATNCYYVTGMDMITATYCTATCCENMELGKMTDGTLLDKLNAISGGPEWKADSENYPTLSSGVIPDDPTPGSQKTRKRVSIIGDSISTWSGWVPSGYSCHYPASTGNEPPTKVSQSWWYRLIYDNMKNAEFDTNLAYSGTNLADIPKDVFDQWVKDHPTSKTTWYGNDMIKRFIDKNGMGTPNVIVIFGGTNDWNHNCGYLVGTKKLRGTTDIAPSDMASSFTTADAATTYVQALALVSSTFVDGYLKLIRLIHTKYPDCKVVMLVPYYGGRSMESVILQIADHYSFCKAVDLFAVNGFQDTGLWDYAGGTFPSGTYTQPHMPTHDFNSENGHGAHLNVTGMKYVADKIYNELGTWLDN